MNLNDILRSAYKIVCDGFDRIDDGVTDETLNLFQKIQRQAAKGATKVSGIKKSRAEGMKEYKFDISRFIPADPKEIEKKIEIDKKRANLENLTKKELLEVAKEIGKEINPRIKKVDLIKELVN